MRRRSSRVRPTHIDRRSNNRKKHNDTSVPKNSKYMNAELSRSDIKRRAIQVLYTEGVEKRTGIGSSETCPHGILHPNSSTRRSFDFFTVIWVLFLVFIIPFMIGFDWYVEPKGLKLFLNLLDVWFAIDIILNFRTGYIHHGTIIMKSKKIFWNYLTTWFLVDLLGTFPFENLLKGEATSRKSLKLIKYFKIPKLLRVSRLMKYVRDHKQVYDLFQVFVLIFTFLHLGACLWMIVLNPCPDGNETNSSAICAQENIPNLYAESFHLTAVMMLGVSNSHIIGDSTSLDMMAERLKVQQIPMYVVSTLYMLGGICLIALLISELNVFLFGKKQGSATFQRKIDRVSYEMEYYSIPDDIQRQVKAFYDYVWIHQKQYDDKIALLSDDQMSTDLQRKLALHLFKDVVSHITLFSEIDDLLLGEICLSLRARIFLPDDMILFKGDVGKELFIISKGVVQVLRDDLPPSQRNLAPPIYLHNGSFFGEIALIMETRRTCSVQARTICETNILCQKTFDSILKQNPDFAHRMNELVVARQLERSLSKSKDQENEVRVSHIDMANALSAVERNMKKGLQRRLQQSYLVRKSHVSNHSDDTIELEADIKSTSFLNGQSKETRDKRHKNVLQHMRSSLKLSLASTHEEDNEEISRMIEDIAQRSTIATKNAAKQPEGLRSRCNTNDSSDVETGKKKSDDNDDVPSQESAIITTDEAREKDSLKEDLFWVDDGDGQDAERMIITGQYNPQKVQIDIKKVHPTILNSGKSYSSSVPKIYEQQLSKIDQRLEAQEDMMKRILSKVDASAFNDDSIPPSTSNV